MSARDRILQRLHQASPTGSAGRATGKPPPLPAQWIDSDSAQILDFFTAQAQRSGATVRKLSGVDELRDVISALAKTSPVEIYGCEFVSFNGIPASDSGASGACTVVRADAAIAETGTVCIHSRQAPSRSLFLCDHLVVVLHQTDIHRHQEDYWLRQAADNVPSAVHLITGPSRTADVEQTIQVGAHGPKLVTLLVCD